MSKLQKPKVLFILTSTSFGGLELYVCNLLLEFVQKGIDIHIICSSKSPVYSYLKPRFNNIYEVSKPSYFNIYHILKLVIYIKKNKISVVHSHTRIDVWLGSILNFLTGILHINSVYMIPVNKNDFLHKFIYKKLRYIISSSFVMNQLIGKHYPVAKEKIKLIRYGCNSDKYFHDEMKRSELKTKFNSQGKIIIGTLCRIDKQKGVLDLAESINFLPDDIKGQIVFWIIGSPSVQKLDDNLNEIYELEALETINKLNEFISGNNVSEFFRLIPFQQDYIPYLDCFNIFVLASHSEMYSLSVIDAMFMKKAVIGTNTGGTIEQLDCNRGLLCEPENPVSIAEKIIYLIKNPEKSEFLSESAYNWVQAEHTMEKCTSELLKIYSE